MHCPLGPAQVVLCVHLLGAPLPRYKVPVIEYCHNVSLSEKLFMCWQCDQVEEPCLTQFDLASAALIIAARAQTRGWHYHQVRLGTTGFVLL